MDILRSLLHTPDWGQYQGMVDHFLSWSQYPLFEDMLRTLRQDLLFDSSVHGPPHIIRTLLHGAMCAQAEHLSSDETPVLLLACSYHDIGRLNDQPDPEHGRRGAERLAPLLNVPDAPVILGAIHAHSLPDSVLHETLLLYGTQDSPFARTVALLLKDADALDRVRIWDLDSRYLRYPSSVERTGFAQMLYLRYQDAAGLPRVPDFVQKWKGLDAMGRPLQGKPLQ